MVDVPPFSSIPYIKRVFFISFAMAKISSRLEHVARHRPLAQGLRRVPPQQVAGQSRVREVELGRLGQALDGVGPQRAQQPHHAGGPQDG